MRSLYTYILERLDSVLIDNPKKGEVEPKNISLKSFIPKKELNLNIWNGKILKPEVVKALKEISKLFVEKYDWLKLAYVDTHVLGSLASYNWSSYSDIDFHIIVDFAILGTDHEAIKRQADSAKNTWNNEHTHLFVNGFPVELYVQDKNETNAAQGVWSIELNTWLKEPEYSEETMDKSEIKKLTAKYANRIDNLNEKVKKTQDKSTLKEYRETAKNLWDNVVKGRREGLAREGEWSVENIVFKALRRTKHVETLKNLKNLAFDKIYSL